LLVYLRLMVITTIFHELMHYLVKLVYGPQATPPGAGGRISIVGESGEELEELLVGGKVEVLWNSEDVAEMEKILGLVIEYRGALRDLRESCPVHNSCMFVTNIKLWQR
jgi:hypothetical protein